MVWLFFEAPHQKTTMAEAKVGQDQFLLQETACLSKLWHAWNLKKVEVVLDCLGQQCRSFFFPIAMSFPGPKLILQPGSCDQDWLKRWFEHGRTWKWWKFQSYLALSMFIYIFDLYKIIVSGWDVTGNWHAFHCISPFFLYMNNKKHKVCACRVLKSRNLKFEMVWMLVPCRQTIR